MQEKNLPDVTVRVVSVTLPQARGILIRLQCLMRTGDWTTMKQWECSTGRPSGQDLRDIVACAGDEITTALITRYGIQETFVT